MAIKLKGNYEDVSTLLPFSAKIEKAILLYQEVKSLREQADILKGQAEDICAEVVLETGMDKFATEEDGTITLQEGRMFLNEKGLLENLLKAGIEAEIVDKAIKKSKKKGAAFYVYRAPKAVKGE